MEILGFLREFGEKSMNHPRTSQTIWGTIHENPRISLGIPGESSMEILGFPRKVGEKSKEFVL